MRSDAWGPDPIGLQSLYEEEATQSPLSPYVVRAKERPSASPGAKPS